LHIAFVDFIAWDYTIETAYQRPLGGSQSALCYLAEQLALRGHEVQLINNAAVPGVSRGVVCLPLAKARPEVWRGFDAVVMLNAVKQGLAIRPLLRPDAKLIAWLQHADDQPAVRGLANAEFREAFDRFAFVSQWQRGRFQEVFGVPAERSRVMRNAIGPAFRGLVRSPHPPSTSSGQAGPLPEGEGETAASQRPDDRPKPQANGPQPKAHSPILAYTSTPFRGLDLLVHAFPAIRKEAPGTTLRVYSSMQVYQTPSEKDAAQYGALYQLCRDTPGIEYIGSLPQAELAAQLVEADVLAYPNHFAETSCIAVMEAMAAGCYVMSSQLGALPETTAGFGRLLPVGDSWLDYTDRFIEEMAKLLDEMQKQPAKFEAELARQVEFVNAEYDWAKRAAEWEEWLA